MGLFSSIGDIASGGWDMAKSAVGLPVRAVADTAIGAGDGLFKGQNWLSWLGSWAGLIIGAGYAFMKGGGDPAHTLQAMAIDGFGGWIAGYAGGSVVGMGLGAPIGALTGLASAFRSPSGPGRALPEPAIPAPPQPQLAASEPLTPSVTPNVSGNGAGQART